MRFRFRAAALAGALLASAAQPSAAHIPVDNRHLITVVNRTDACVWVALFRHATGLPTSPRTKRYQLAPGARFSVWLFNRPNDVIVDATVLTSAACTNSRSYAAVFDPYAGRGYVTIVGKKPTYSVVFGPS